MSYWYRFEKESDAFVSEMRINVANGLPMKKTKRWFCPDICDDGKFAMPDPGEEYSGCIHKGTRERYCESWFESREVRV